ncbi:MAG: hypothetical protein EOO65_05830, partial [Methanosarcinales archaeon]
MSVSFLPRCRDTGLLVTETTNDIFNHALYDLMKPQSLFAWQRVRLANLMATDAPSWVSIFSKNYPQSY